MVFRKCFGDSEAFANHGFISCLCVGTSLAGAKWAMSAAIVPPQSPIKCVLKPSPNFSSISQPRSDQDEKVRSPMYKSYVMEEA
jgi:hypothetical protein